MNKVQVKKEELKVGLLGCGRVASHHLRFIRSVRNARIVGLVDQDRENAKRAGEPYGITSVYDSLELLLDFSPVDVLHILTPPQLHFAQACAAIERGLHVLVEKPLTFKSSDAEALYRLAADRKVSLCPDFIQLFHPLFLKARSLVESRVLGRVLHVDSHMSLDLQAVPELTESVHLHWSFRLPGGILHNYVTHPLYLALFWAGVPQKMSVQARSLGTLPQGLVDHLLVQVEGTRCNASIVLSLGIRPEQYFVALFCEKGKLVVNFDTGTMIVSPVGSLPRAVRRATSNFSEALQLSSDGFGNIVNYLRGRLIPYQGLQNLIPQFYSSILQGGADPPISPELAIAVTRAEELIFQEKGRWHLGPSARPSSQVRVTKSERILVTGASGYVGTHVVKRLVEAGYFVRALVRGLSRTRFLEEMGVEIQEGDIRDQDSLLRACQGIDVVVHAAAGLRGSRDFILSTCVAGTCNVAQAARLAGLRRVIYFSSMSVYDFLRIGNGDIITEESPLEPSPEHRGAYSLAKRKAEDVAMSCLNHGGPAWSILRPSAVVGNSQDVLGATGGVRLGRFLICLSSARKPLRFVHVEDVAEAVLQILQNEKTKREIFTLSSPEPIRLKQYIQQHVKVQHPEIRTIFVPYWFALLASRVLALAGKFTGRGPTLSRSRLAYLYCRSRAGSTKLFEYTDWQPTHTILLHLNK